MKQASFLLVLISFTSIGLFQLSFFQGIEKQTRNNRKIYINKSLNLSVCERPSGFPVEKTQTLLADSAFAADADLMNADTIAFIDNFTASLSTEAEKSYYEILFPAPVKQKKQRRRTYTVERESSKHTYTVELNIPEGQKYKLADSLSENQIRAQLISYAKQFMGLRYKWGGTTSAGFDCSGLTGYVYENVAGLNIPRTSHYQSKVGEQIDMSQAKAGDLVFFGYRRGNSYRTKHVGLVVSYSNGKLAMLHSSRDGVKIDYDVLDSPYYKRRYLFVKRLF